MSAIGRPPYRRGSKKKEGFQVSVVNGKPALQVNFGGAIYSARLSAAGTPAHNISESFRDINVGGTAIFDSGAGVARLTSSGLSVREGGVEVASFGETAFVKDISLTGKIVLTTDNDNICIGSDNNDVGSNNIAISNNACASLQSNSENNIGIGSFALQDCESSSSNIAIGRMSGMKITHGNTNVLIGTAAGVGANEASNMTDRVAITTGEDNICIGSYSGVATADCLSSIAIGSYAFNHGPHSIAIGTNTTAGHGSIAIGDGATATASREVVIGNGVYGKGIHTTTIGGILGFFPEGALLQSEVGTPIRIGDVEQNFHSSLKIFARLPQAGLQNPWPYPLEIHNDYGSVLGEGMRISAGDPSPSSNNDIKWIYLCDGNGTGISSINYLSSSPGAAFVAASDSRLKDNIEDADISGLETMSNIRWRQFDWNEEKAKEFGYGKRGHDNMGVISQEIEQFFPEVVTKGDTGMKETSMSWMLPYACKAIQELLTRVEALEANQ